MRRRPRTRPKPTRRPKPTGRRKPPARHRRPARPAARAARPPRSVRLLNRTTLRRESPEFRTALLTRAARNIADAKDMADRQAAGQAFTVFPPAWTPPVSRLTTEGALLTAALVAGREAVNVLFDETDDDQTEQHR